MPENLTVSNKFNAIIVDPRTDKFLAKVCLDGRTFPSNEWISTQGNLQSFELLDEKKGFWDVWVNQREVILRTEHTQRVIKITTYPTEGENQGFLNYISDVREYKKSIQHEDQSKPKGKLTFLRALFDA